MYYKITRAIENCYKKRIEKNVPIEAMENWKTSLKETWKKNPDILKFIDTLGKTKNKYNFIIDGEGTRKKLITSDFSWVEQEWTQRSIEGQNKNGSYLKTWFEILENDKRVFRSRFDLVGKFEELSLYYYLKEEFLKYMQQDKENTRPLLKILSLLYSLKNNVPIEKVNTYLICTSQKYLCLIIESEPLDNLKDILSRWQEKQEKQVVCKQFNFESEVK